MDDADLVRACREGSREAWEEFFDRHGPFLLGLIHRRLAGCPGSDPDAVFQEFWLALFEKGAHRLSFADPERPLKPYLAAIALELCRRHFAREARRRGLEAVLPSLPEAARAPQPPEEAVRREDLEALARGLEGLSPRERLAVDLVHLQGLSYAQAGRKLGLTEVAVGTLLSRARPKIRKIGESPPGTPAPRQ